MNTLVYITLLLSFVFIGCGALSWNDCGAPLSRTISFQNLVVYPESPNSQDAISLNVQATVMYGFNDATTNVFITKDGELYLAANGRNLCSVLATTQTTITCPIAAGQYSFNYVYPLPTLPAGTYVISVSFNDINSGAALGCVSTTLVIGDNDQSDDQCSFMSKLSMVFGTTRLNTNNNSTIGSSWIQVGPYGSNAGAVASNLPWGHFVSYAGTTDIIDVKIDLSPYVWGLNGTQYIPAGSSNSSTSADSSYRGDFVVGYRPYPGASLANVQIIASGQFDITINYVANRVPRSQILTSGALSFNPQYSFPVGFFYPLVFGSLNNYTITQSSDGSLTAFGSKVWCTCAIDVCGVCGGNGQQCNPSNLIVNQNTRHHGLSDYDIAAIVIGCIAFLLLIAVIVLLMRLRRRGRENRTVRDDTDLAGPDKPDYGSMAINEVLADHGRPLIINHQI